MEQVNLPTEEALEPCEEAQQSRTEITMSLGTNFSSQENSFIEALSQPPDGLSQSQRLQWIQKRRTLGLWAQCDGCDKWRYLPDVLDRYQLPNKWYCAMNPDITKADCSVPETPILPSEEEELIHAEYSAGSVVWARLAGWPWWPAMVDDCPVTEQYFWLDGFSDIPTHYHVVFFDIAEVTRAWVSPKRLKPYLLNRGNFNGDRVYKKRIQASLLQAEDAINLSLGDRLDKYSFLTRYKGTINAPQKIENFNIKKHQTYLKKKFNVDFDV